MKSITFCYRYVVLATDGLPGRIASFIRTVDPSLIVLTIPRVGWWDPWTLYKSPKAYSQIIENVVSRLSRPKRVRDVSKQSILELYLLSKCQAFVGAAFSNFFRVAFWVSLLQAQLFKEIHNVVESRRAMDETESFHLSIMWTILGAFIRSAPQRRMTSNTAWIQTSPKTSVRLHR